MRNPRSRAAPAPGIASSSLAVAGPQGAGDVQTSPFRGRSGATVAATEAERLGQLAHQRVELVLGGLGPLQPAVGDGVVDLAAQLLDPVAVGRAGSPVEHRTGVAQLVPANSSCWGRTLDPIDQVEGVALLAGTGNELGEVAQALAVR